MGVAVGIATGMSELAIVGMASFADTISDKGDSIRSLATNTIGLRD
jgi:hypothetical protein